VLSGDWPLDRFFSAPGRAPLQDSAAARSSVRDHRAAIADGAAVAAEQGLAAVDVEGVNIDSPRERGDSRAYPSVPHLRRVSEERSIRGQLFARRPGARTRDEAAAVIDEHDSVEASPRAGRGELVMQRRDHVIAPSATALGALLRPAVGSARLFRLDQEDLLAQYDGKRRPARPSLRSAA